MERRNKKYILFILILALTLVVVLTGVLFTARNFKAYCYNDIDEEINSKVTSIVKSECENRSIFLINEEELKRKIESKIPNVEVKSVERIFPDSLKINYAIKKNYAYVIADGVYKYLSKDCKVLATDGGELANSHNLIKITTSETPLTGAVLYDKKGNTASYFFGLIDVMERMGFKMAEDMIEEVDFSRISAHLIVLKWRTGAHIHVEYPENNFEQKIQLAVSALTSCEESKRTSGVWRVYSDKIAYSEK
ncbi:MAG: FtsQ-type POTRA domain-containing protein [Clostridiales bacterium]|nr:FtsQ-type POTRA domain-containing protein [Clostridiales bacterium]